MTDLNPIHIHGRVTTSLPGVVVMAAILSAASLPGTPEWPGTHARRMCFPLASLSHITVAICQRRACPLWCSGFEIATRADMLSSYMVMTFCDPATELRTTSVQSTTSMTARTSEMYAFTL